jgi:hypothetical protein
VPVRVLAMVLFALLGACGGGDAPPGEGDGGPSVPVEISVDYAGDLWDAPWPDARLRRADGSIDLSGFRNDPRVRLSGQLLDLLEAADGFGRSSTIFFAPRVPLDPATLPDVLGSLRPTASVQLLDVDAASPERLQRRPIRVGYVDRPGPFGPAPHLLGVLPEQGRPLRAATRYAAVVTRQVRSTEGVPLDVAAAVRTLVDGGAPAGVENRTLAVYRDALAALEEAGVDLEAVVAFAVFRTGDPEAELRAAAAARPPPPAFAPFVLAEVFDDYCAYRSEVPMPVYQGGEAPYLNEGGGWVRDVDGRLVEQRRAASRVWLTVPRRAPPEDGVPLHVFVRTGGGGDRPLLDRSPREAGVESTPGAGPAEALARAGLAAISVDGPLGGLRNVDGWDEQFAIFNIQNPASLRDSIRQSALELALLADTLEGLSLDAADCPGVEAEVPFDTAHLGLFGHSMGATIAPLAAAIAPRYRALVLSGAGGSWIENVLHKERPIATLPVAQLLLNYGSTIAITDWDPVLNLLQWAGEPADPQVYAPGLGDRHVLMFQGVLDRYIPPPIANGLSLAFALDRAGGPVDEALADRFTPLGAYLPLAGARDLPLPASGNRDDGARTAVLVQHLEDGVLDGHEVVFQRPAPRLQYRCFLRDLAAGAVPRVVDREAEACP